VKVLLSSIVYRPEPTGYRAHDLAVGLADLGHEVVVVTGLPSYPLGHVYDGYKTRFWQWKSLDGIQLLRVPYVMSRSRSAVRRVISYSAFSLLTTVTHLFNRWRPDAIWTNQVGLPGVLLSAMKRTTFVHEVQDLWPEWTATADLGIRGWLYRLLDWQQRLIYDRAEAITTISDGFRNWLVQKGVTGDKITVIPNWADAECFHPVPRDETLGADEDLVGRFNVVYAGNIGIAQALDVVLEAADVLQNEPDLQFVIIGDGLERARLENEAKKRGLYNVRFLGRRKPEELAYYLAWADLLLIHLKCDPRYAITIPSKTYSYLACGRPILAGAEGDVANLVRDCRAGLVVPPEDPVALASALQEAMRMPKSDREQFGHNGWRAFQELFDRRVLVRRYEAVFSRVAAADGNGKP
jgi:colanic acid biosynthesis glycosyl transferase WcaI